MSSPSKDESFVVGRYRLWEQWAGQYKYKHLKGERIARILEETGGLPAVAVELGVGPGGVASALSRRGMLVIGIDLSPEALIRAREHCAADSVALMRASGFALPFLDASIALVYASQVLHLFDDSGRVALMNECRRVLVPRGRFVFDMKNPLSHPWGYLRRDRARRAKNFPPLRAVEALLHKAGFDHVDRKPGLLPRLPWTSFSATGVLGRFAHTTFFVAHK